jgi:DNA topoisomerase-2
MILVNGGEGSGTGCSTYIPNYNPRDIIANLRRLLNDEPTKPMHPWYRGFKVCNSVELSEVWDLFIYL